MKPFYTSKFWANRCDSKNKLFEIFCCDLLKRKGNYYEKILTLAVSSLLLFTLTACTGEITWEDDIL